MTTDTIRIPAPYLGMRDAELRVWTDNGDSYTMALISECGEGRTIAEASGFRPGACQDFGEEHPRRTAGTFGAFLSHALEDAEFAGQWETIADDADTWADALASMDWSGDAGEDIAEAVRTDHPCRDDDTCDIARALEDGYPLWAAYLLVSATEAPATSEAVSHYHPSDFDAEAASERDAWLQTSTWTEQAHRCEACGSITFGTDTYEPETCGACGSDALSYALS